MLTQAKTTAGIKQLIVWGAVALIGFWIFSGLAACRLSTPILLTMHNIMELSSIILGFIIFFVTWYSANGSVGVQATTISLVMLCSSLFDLGHVLAYPGMPEMTAEHISHLWITYSLFARFVWAFGLLYSMNLPSNHTIAPTLPNRTLLYSTIILVAGVIANITLNYNAWPSFYIDRYDHPIALWARRFNVLADLGALFILHRYQKDHVSGPFLRFALIFGLLADISYCLSNYNPLILNISGHFTKIFASYYVLRAIFVVVIQRPYDEIMKFRDEMEELAANNANLYKESEQQRNLIEDTLAKVGTIISSQLNLKDTVDAIADMVADMMRARQSSIALLNKDHTALEVAATYGINTPPDNIPLISSVAGKVLERKTAIYIDDLSLHPELFRPQLIFSNIRSIICAPLVNEREIIGVIEAYHSEKSAFNDRDALLLKALGTHLGAAIASADLYEETKLHLTEEKFLYQIAQSAASTIDTDTIMIQCTGHTVQALNADMGIGFLVGNDKGLLVVKAAVGTDDCTGLTVDLNSQPDLAELISTNRPATANGKIVPLLNTLSKDTGVKQVLLLPLTVNHRLLGLIILGWQRFIIAERLERLSFAALMAQQIALGLEKASLYNQVKAMALSDGLTGLANRRNFDMFLKSELRRAASLKRPLSLIMFDLDKFKTYNDTYGHLIGDKLLAQIGEILRHNVRSIDLPARYGGEEFSIILPECGNAEAIAIAEKLRKAVETSSFPDNVGSLTARITASLGVTSYDPALTTEAPDIEMMIATADKSLYEAKQKGRNRVVNSTVIG